MFGWIKSLFRKKSSARPPIQVANLQGLGKRQNQEDAFAFVNALDAEQYAKQGMMFCVCDGMGGMKGGRLAAETAVKSLRSSFSSFDRSKDIAPQLKKSAADASARVVASLGGNGGTTAVAGVIADGRLYYVSVGDSYLYLLRGGRLLRLNTTHNMCHLKYLEAIRNGRLDPLAGRLHVETAALTGFLGMEGYAVTPDGSRLPLVLQKGDVILACSDGVGGVLEPSALTEAMNAPTVQAMCDNITRRIETLARPYQDNYTALLIGYRLAE